MQAAHQGVPTELTEDYDPTIADDSHIYNDGARHFTHPYPHGFVPGDGVGVYTPRDETYQNGLRRWRVAGSRPLAADDATVLRLHANDDEEVVLTAETIMPTIRRSEDVVGCAPATTNER